jgi:hypothetical protein
MLHHERFEELAADGSVAKAWVDSGDRSNTDCMDCGEAVELA